MNIIETNNYTVRAEVSKDEFDRMSRLLWDDYRNGTPFIDSFGNSCRVVHYSLTKFVTGKRRLDFTLTTGKGIGLGEIVTE